MQGKSDGEVMRFCQAFMTELQRHIGACPFTSGDLKQPPGYLECQRAALNRHPEQALCVYEMRCLDKNSAAQCQMLTAAPTLHQREFKVIYIRCSRYFQDSLNFLDSVVHGISGGYV